jgi:hypothetical protein
LENPFPMFQSSMSMALSPGLATAWADCSALSFHPHPH